MHESTRTRGSDHVMRAILLACWAMILAKVTLLLLGERSPGYVEVSYIVAFPVALWNLKRARELLGGWFFVGLLLYLAIGAAGWTVNQWQKALGSGEGAALSIPWLIGTTVLALNFLILLFFIGRELIVNPAVQNDETSDGVATQPPA